MALAAGARLGPYEVTAQIGKGGMGEVWRATDTKLNRQVALKILPEAFASDPDRLARFEREAKVLASLNHPNIAIIHGLEEAAGVKALVLELVEGPTLAERIAHGPIPLDDALPIAKQIAEALEAAHEHGIIHRDLKPANIKLRPDGTVKVLDFGLAKALDPAPASADLSQSPTISVAATQRGVILGTAAYMSPEQARGRPVDKRADIWAFGCVLLEMLTGRRAFSGDLASDILAAVIRAEPEWEGLPANLHPNIRALLERCLEKNPKQRWHDIADVRLDIQKALADPGGLFLDPAAVAHAAPRSMLPGIALWVVLAAAASAIGTWTLTPAEPRLVSRLAVHLPAPLPPYASIALSPDGRRLVYTAEGRLYLRAMDETEAAPIPGTEGGVAPFFSPDGEWIAFSTPTQLKKVRAAGGGVTVLADVDQGLEGVWDSEDRIFFGRAGPTGLFQIPANGGAIQPFADLGSYGDLDYPTVLPGGEWVLFTALVSQYTEWDNAQIVAQSVDTGERKVVLEGGHYARYVPTGHLVYARYGRLFAVGFDAERIEAVGDPVLLLDSVSADSQDAGQARFAVASIAGTLAFASGSDRAHRLALLDSGGAVEFLDLAPRPYASPRVSPDGSRVAVHTDNDGRSEIWIFDPSGSADIRRLPQEGNNRVPVWTPDGQTITFASDREGRWGIYLQPADGSGAAKLLTMAEEGSLYLPDSWSPDGRVLAFTDMRAGRINIGTFDRANGERSPFFPKASGDMTSFSQFSADGRWIAYQRSEGAAYLTTGIYVQPFPPTGVEHTIAQSRATRPLWSPDRRALFYLHTEGTIRRIAVSTDRIVTSGNEQTLPSALLPIPSSYRNYDIMPDGRILMVTEGESNRPQIHIVLNWFEELKARAPVP